MTEKRAVLYRMETPEHRCPWGLKTRHLLERKGYRVEDRKLTSRDATDAFMAEHGVKTTPQTFIGGERIGGYEDVKAFFGEPVERKETSYTPVIALFAVAALMALAIAWITPGALIRIDTAEYFIATAMVLLGLQKLKDVDGFATMFLSYDLLARKYGRYGYVYPFVETGAGLLMLAGAAIWLAAPAALFIGTVGAVSVFTAVYVEKRALKCACMGGDSNVPLGFVSLTENLIMIAMAIWMPLRMWVL
jgi:glutaredoxin